MAFWEQTLRRKKVSSWKVQEMKLLLQLRGMDHSERKAALQARVKSLLFPNDGEASVSNPPQPETSLDVGPACDVAFPETGWKKLVDETPQSLNLGFNFGSLCIYFDARKESDGLPSENLRSVSRRSIGLYRAKYCRDVEVARIDGSGDVFLTGYCKAEMKTRERYHIKMRLAASGFSSDGKIDDLKFASCQCKAGRGQTASCKHIAAFCFGLDHFTRRSVFEGVTSCTSDLQRWNAPPAKRQCSDITFTAAAFGKTCEPSTRSSCDPRPVALRTVDPKAEQTKLASLLSSCTSVRSGILDTLQPPASSGTPTPSTPALTELRTVREVLCDFEKRKGGNDIRQWCGDVLHELQLSDRQRHALKYRTRGQGDCSLWKDHRYGRLTASNFGRVFVRSSSTGTLVHSLLYRGALPALPALAYDREHEEDARDAYVLWQAEQGRAVTVRSVGLHIMANGFLGCSPDGIIHDASLGSAEGAHGILEIKCPSSAAEVPLSEVAKKPHFCAKIDASGRIQLKRSYHYYYQVQGNMGVTGLRWCDFVLWSPLELSVERITFDEKLWDDMLKKLGHFYRHWFLPELLLCKGLEGKEIEKVVY